jgi:hypothetical protein
LTLQALNYSFDRGEFGAYFVIDGSDYVEETSSSVGGGGGGTGTGLDKRILKCLYSYTEQFFNDSLTVQELVKGYKWPSDRTVLLFHKFKLDQHEALAGIISCLSKLVIGSSSSSSLKLVVTTTTDTTATPLTSLPAFPKVYMKTYAIVLILGAIHVFFFHVYFLHFICCLFCMNTSHTKLLAYPK